MKISTKGRYAVRLMLDLAMHNTGEAVSIKDISKRQGVSDKYLEQIISVLNKAGYVRSIRGAQGGYMLKKDPKDYTVGLLKVHLHLYRVLMMTIWYVKEKTVVLRFMYGKN